MKTMIDTNILYNLVGFSDTDPRAIRTLSQEIEKLKPLFISELSLLELLTHKKFDNEAIKKVFKYITANNINFVNFLPLDSSLLRNVFINFDDAKGIDEIKKKALENKIRIEAETLPLVIVASVTVLALFYDKKTTDHEARIRLSMHLVSLIEGNITFIRMLCRETVERYYQSFNSRDFKDDIKGYILAFAYVLTLNYALSENGLLLRDLDIDSPGLIDTSIIETNNSIEFRSHILSKLKGKRPTGLLAKKIFWKDLKVQLKVFFDSLHTEFNPGIINYYSLYIYEMLTTDCKFEKNNLIDSLFHEYGQSFLVYTLDETLTESFKEVDPELYKRLVELQKKLK